jgi:chemotaxis-related protein WspD
MTEKQPGRAETDNSPDDCWSRIGEKAPHDRRCERLVEIIRCRNCPVFINAGRRLLNRPLNEEYQRQLTEHYGAPTTTAKTKSMKSFVFRVGSEWLGIHSDLIREVVNMGAIHSIPHKSSRIFKGIVNIRGRLELCVSIGGILRIEPDRGDYGRSPERLIVISRAGQSMVFPVSEVLGPLRYEKDDIKPLPPSVSGARAVYTKHILISPKREISLLDDVLLFRILTRNLE